MRHRLPILLLISALFAGTAGSVPVRAIQTPPVSASVRPISRPEFARYIEQWSEPEGYFDTDNFISNETSYLHVIPELQQRVRSGGVYLGVGPDQNFSYIARTKPSVAIIVDIRRQNMLQHLFMKALFELAANRTEYLALFFATDIPTVNREGSLPELLRAVRQARKGNDTYQRDLAAVKKKIGEFGIPLGADDWQKIEYVYRSFHEEGLDLRFSSLGRNNASQYPTYESLLLETDRAGKMQNYLADEQSFQWLKQFQAENRLIPVVGDFAGPHAFRAVAAFLSKSSLKVSTFYTSNVEYYLFGQSSWKRYIDNVRALPFSDQAVFIRSYFANAGPVHPQSVPGHRSTSLVQDVARFLSDERAGRIREYWDVVNR